LLRMRSGEYTGKIYMINQEIGSYTNKNISIQMNQFLQQKYQMGSRSRNYLCFSYFFIERRMLIQMLGFLSMQELKIEEPYHEIVSLLRERSREYTEKSCMINQEIGSYTNKNISIQMNQFLQQKYQIGSRS